MFPPIKTQNVALKKKIKFSLSPLFYLIKIIFSKFIYLKYTVYPHYLGQKYLDLKMTNILNLGDYI